MAYGHPLALRSLLRLRHGGALAPFRSCLQRCTRLRTYSSTACAQAALPRSTLFDAIRSHDPESTAVVHSRSGRSFSYGSLLHDVTETTDRLSTLLGDGLDSKSVAFLIENSYDYVVTLLSLFASNARAVPLSPAFPASELRYLIDQSQAGALVASTKFDMLALDVLQEGVEKQVRHLHMGKLLRGSMDKEEIQLQDEHSDTSSGGLMLYTSGTTARPKGVLLDQDVLVAQAKSLLEAWRYSPNDRLLHLLPLHHIHGVVNAIIAPLLAGSTIEFMFPFNPDTVWRRLASPFLSGGNASSKESSKGPITFLTAVPTIWSRLLRSHSELPEEIKEASKEAIQRKNLRLNISGSAALPVPVKQAWTELSDGNILLERYGMTEVGMALSCGLADEDRIDASVGWPLPSVKVRLADSDTNEIIQSQTNEAGQEHAGEIQLRGPTIFKAYWRNQDATARQFTPDGWFKTGDIAVRRSISGAGLGSSGDWAKGPAYFILGRESADIIKMGGEKISALEIERELLSLPEIRECAVVALPSERWGQKVAAVIVFSGVSETAGKPGHEWSAMDVRRALKGKLAAYKLPSVVKMVQEIPRNAMGKVNKKELISRIFGPVESSP